MVLAVSNVIKSNVTIKQQKKLNILKEMYLLVFLFPKVVLNKWLQDPFGYTGHNKRVFCCTKI